MNGIKKLMKCKIDSKTWAEFKNTQVNFAAKTKGSGLLLPEWLHGLCRIEPDVFIKLTRQ